MTYVNGEGISAPDERVREINVRTDERVSEINVRERKFAKEKKMYKILNTVVSGCLFKVVSRLLR